MSGNQGFTWGTRPVAPTHGFGAWLMIWKRVEATGVAVLAGLLFIATMVLGWMLVIDGTYYNPPVVYESTYLNTDKTEYSPGDVVSVFMDLYKGRNIEGCVTWSLVNGRVFPYAKRKLGSPAGVYEKWYALESEKLPTANLGSSESMYHFEALVEYQVNRLKTVTYKLKTSSFKIVPKVSQ